MTFLCQNINNGIKRNDHQESEPVRHNSARFSYAAFCCCCEHHKDLALSSKERQAMFGGLSAREVLLSLLVHANATQIF